MSANRIAASTPSRRTGWSVTSAHSAGSRVISSSVARSRIAPVLGQRAAGLAHEPHRRRVDGQAAGRPQVAGLGTRREGRASAGEDLGGHADERLARRGQGRLDLGLAVGRRDEPGLELRRGEQDAPVEHRAEEPGVGVAVGGEGLGGVPRDPAAEEDRQQRPDPGDRDVAPGRPRQRRAALPRGRRRWPRAPRRPRASSRSSVATPAAIVSGCPDSVPAWYTPPSGATWPSGRPGRRRRRPASRRR